MTPRLKIALAAVALTAAACTPPPVGAGKARFDWWASTHITVYYGDLSAIPGGICGITDSAHWTVTLDSACIARRGDPAGTSPGTTAVYTRDHEFGHIVNDNIFGRVYGLGTPVVYGGGVYFPGSEQAAQCIQEVLDGWPLVPVLPAGVANTLGYWDCPPDQVERFRTLMISVGIL